LFVRRASNGADNIWSASIDGKPPKQITTFDSGRIFAFDADPGNRLALSRGSYVSDVVLIRNTK
jgi:hypothetical protein